MTAMALVSPATILGQDELLKGEIIGDVNGIQYTSSGSAYSVGDIRGNAFDGDLDTYFATNARSYTWVGMDLGTPHVITRVGWAPRNEAVGPERVRCGVIQGANSPDFLDALPIYVIPESGERMRMQYAETSCSRGFRYVRFVSTGDARCNIAELEFYGHEGEGDDLHLYQPTNLPLVVINTLNAEEPYDKEHNIVSNIIILDKNGKNLEASGSVRERGNGSREFPKKPWRIKFDKKQQPLDAPAKLKKWTLINNYGDKTLMRNLVAFEIARRLEMPFVSYAQPVDVILNGEYKGCYQLCDQMEVNPGRLEITEMDENDVDGDALTGGYFIEVDAYADQEPAGTWFMSDRRIPVTIKSPDLEGELYRASQYNYIRNYFQRFENLVYSDNFADPQAGYRSVFDIDSFIKHFIVGELSGNTDTYWSTYMYKERLDPILHTGPVWDFDLGFDNDQRTYPVDRYNDYLFNSSGASAATGMKELAKRIIYDDPKTSEDISRIWSRARNRKGLTAEKINEYIDAMAKEINESQDLNFKRWPILNSRVHQNPRALGSYEAEVNAMKDYVTKRFAKLDKLMKYDESETGVGRVETNTVEADEVSAVYDITGRSLMGLSPGLNIVVYKSGRTCKVLMK